MINLKKMSELDGFLGATDKLIDIDLHLSVDNRDLDLETIFIAIVGSRYNPLKDLDKVKKSGAKFVVYERNDESDKLIAPHVDDLVFIAVKDLTSYIASLGTLCADLFKERGGKIIAISGSNGKTTTKEMLSFILEEHLGADKIISTRKNNNNHLGVPFTLFQIRKETKIAVVELGSNHPGEIEFLCKILKPQFGVCTNIGDTHLEFFETRENVFKEESSLINYTSDAFFLNTDDELLKTLKNDNVVTYGSETSEFIFKVKGGCYLNELEVINKNITGTHNKVNLLVALSIASKVLGVDSSSLVKFANNFIPTANRSQWLEFMGKKVFLDAYNANPSSMKVSLEEFLDHVNSIGASPSEIALILGDMNELGKNEKEFHKSFSSNMDSKKVGSAIFIGRFSDDYEAGYDGACLKFSSVCDGGEKIISALQPYEYIFIKGSRSLQLESILDIR